jgi:Zn-dependent peptidase ImmA (M78 family)
MPTFDRATIQECNIAIRNLTHSYQLFCQEKNTTKKNVELLMQHCQDEVGKEIQFKVADNTDQLKSIKALYAATQDYYVICTISGLNNCWKRMVITKELFHVIFDNPEYKFDDLDNHIENSVSHAPSVIVEASPISTQHEFLAEYAAMEFLFPLSERAAIIDAGDTDYLAIAERYKVPRYYVEIYLSENYMNFCTDVMKF